MVYRNAKLCIAASSAISKYFGEIGCKNIEVIPNGVDLKRFEGLKRHRKEGFVVITVARLERVKGIEYLIKAIPNVKFLIPGLKLLIIGDGSERRSLEHLVKELSLEDRIRFIGQIPPEGIPEYFAMADCFVLPSLKEGFGIAILEAMAASVPVIASRVGGIPDIVKEEKTGFLVEPKNSDAIARTILRVYSDRQSVENIIGNAKDGLKKYDWQNIAEKVYENYLSCANLSS